MYANLLKTYVYAKYTALTRHRANAVLMLVHRLRRWLNNEPVLFNPFSAGTDYRLQNLTSIVEIPVLKE